MLLRSLVTLVSSVLLSAAALAQPAVPPIPPSEPPSVALRVATFNLEDVRAADLANRSNPRLRALAEIIQRVRPTVILLNEIAYDAPGSPGFVEGASPGQNARLFADNFLAVPQVEGVAPIRFRVYTAPTNTGLASGHDLDNDGQVVTSYPTPPPASADGTPGPQTPEGQRYGNDCWGFGTFPGQYGMALLVDERLEILDAQARTFRLLPWDYMPNNLLPTDPVTSTPWYDDAEREVVRLSSKSHWDVPIRLPDGTILHALCSHPTPPAFDGPEERNVRRNHDEIRFWADYIEDASYIVDDQGRTGGLASREHFVILGDLNRDPADSSAIGNAIGDILLPSPRINPEFTPASDVEFTGRDGPIDPTDTAQWGKRVDYVIPSARIRVLRGGIWRHTPTLRQSFPSDHFPVWADIAVPVGQ